jgi:hypothetical protein
VSKTEGNFDSRKGVFFHGLFSEMVIGPRSTFGQWAARNYFPSLRKMAS